MNRLFFTFILLFSFTLQAQKLKHFENDAFKFDYPKKWRVYKKFQKECCLIVAIAPKNRIKKYVNLESDTNNEMSLVTFYLSKEEFNDGSLQEFMVKRIQLFRSIHKNDDNSTISFEKKNSSHYIEYLSLKGGGAIHQNHLIHYILKDKELYILTFTKETKDDKKYKEEEQIIFNSFVFK